MDRVSFTYRLTADEFIAACNALWSHQAVGQRGNWILAVGLAGATGLSLSFDHWLVLVFAPASIFFAVVTPLRNWLWRRYFAGLIKYSGPITVSFSAEGVDFQSAEGAYSQPWAIFDGFTETAHHIFLHVGLRGAGKQFSVIPKSALSSPDDLIRLLSLISARLPRRAKRWI